MRFFKKEFPRDRFRLYSLGDTHIGSPQYNEKLFKRVIAEIQDDPNAYWCTVGDLMENALEGTLGDVHQQTMPPDAQMQYIVDILMPIRSKGLFMIRGNHEDRTFKKCGMYPEQHISACLGLGPDGNRYVPFLGISVLALFLLKSKTPRGFKCYFTHNTGGGSTPGGKINRTVKTRAIVPDADATFSAHVHMTGRVPVTWKDCSHKGIIDRVGYDYLTGAALKWSDSYAETKVYPPSTQELIKVEFKGATNGRNDNRSQIYGTIGE